ncbi:MAG TPA: hypothetical protein VK586_01165 [Streptosporangiaceae bacterium]|nr:hypothetical protein [Streptosporangiaceae bacterium]
MQTLSQPVLSTQYIQVLVAVTSISGGYDPTGDPVAFAFTDANAYPAAEPSQWYAGSWVAYPGGQDWAQVLVGPVNGGIALATGAWKAWLKITDNPEVPVLQPLILWITP